MKTDKILNCIGNSCPLPIVKTKLTLEELEVGQLLEVIADDPGAKSDFPAWCEANEEELIQNNEENGIFHFVIKKVR